MKCRDEKETNIKFVQLKPKRKYNRFETIIKDKNGNKNKNKKTNMNHKKESKQ